MGHQPRLNLATPEAAEEFGHRVDRLAPHTRPLWGAMTSAQMMAHCAEVLEVANGKRLRGTPWFIRVLRPLIRRMVTSSRPYPQGTRTHPQYLQTVDRDFMAEKMRLLAAVEAFLHSGEGADHVDHPFFGTMRTEDLGWAMAKHLDHHLRQFGV